MIQWVKSLVYNAKGVITMDIGSWIADFDFDTLENVIDILASVADFFATVFGGIASVFDFIMPVFSFLIGLFT